MLGGIPSAVGLCGHHGHKTGTKMLVFFRSLQIALFSYKKGRYLFSNVGRKGLTTFLPNKTTFINSFEIGKMYIWKDWKRT